MADIRIKDLTTEAPTSLTGDFLPIDGGTGTRKLSAYSPSFGGNATVGGTLTVSGTTASVGAGTGSIISKLNGAAGSYKLSIYQSAGVDRWYAGLAAGAESGSDGGAPYSIVALTDAGAVIDNALLITRAAGGSITTPRPVSISATTASTSASSGALVVGNGTSGGLGVGGALYVGSAGTFGGTVRVSTANGTAATFSLLQAGQQQWAVEIPASTTNLRLRAVDAGVDALTLGTNGSGTFAGAVTISSTTASTSTSSGALVVSGGVGVAGAIVTGGIVRCGGSNGLSLGSDTGNIRIDTAGSAGVEFRGLSSADTVTGFTMREMALIDGTTAPSTRAGYATIYVDTADGDLKVKFGDGTVKTIATDT